MAGQQQRARRCMHDIAKTGSASNGLGMGYIPNPVLALKFGDHGVHRCHDLLTIIFFNLDSVRVDRLLA